MRGERRLMCKVTIRKFTIDDIPAKISWINNIENNRYLHYDLPLEYQKTVEWYNRVKDRDDRYDAVIEVDGKPVGLLGLLSISDNDKSAEYYVSIGDVSYKGKGIAYRASKLLLEYAFKFLLMDKVYLYTEKDNINAQKLFEKLGFSKVGLIKNDIFYNGTYRDRYHYVFTRDEYQKQTYVTPIHKMGVVNENNVFIKRDDLIPYSFGGNKARKAKMFFDQIDNGGYDCVVTYGSSHSNHCRVVSNMCASRKIMCIIISPSESSVDTYNLKFMKLFHSKIITVAVDKVHDTIKHTMDDLIRRGKKPFFIPGGGHGNTGTRAYIDCYEEICFYERMHGLWFDYIFLASGTGTTQAGLVCGQILNKHNRDIIGISIARKNPRGREIVLESVYDYFLEMHKAIPKYLDEKVVFLDDYISSGYAESNSMIKETIKNNLIEYGVPMDSTYTAKAFHGMTQYITNNHITGKNILFIHTGGTPLFFDDFGSI